LPPGGLNNAKFKCACQINVKLTTNRNVDVGM
jgi:hypothetical protein